MSFDLGVWYSTAPLSADDAAERHAALCEAEDLESLIEPHPSVRAFLDDLTSRYPSLDDVSDDDLENCPWSCSFDESAGHCLLAMAFSRVDDVALVVMELAQKHGLVCYDPQSDTVHLPRQLRS